MSDYLDRYAARALIIDQDQQVLLMRTRFPQWDQPRWLTPGGGIDDGETPAQAVVREIHEETGLRLEQDRHAVTGPVWRRRARFDFDTVRFDQRELFFVVHVERFTPVPHNNPAAHELDAHLEFRWWSAADIAASTDMFIPGAFARHLAALSDIIPESPIDVGR